MGASGSVPTDAERPFIEKVKELKGALGMDEGATVAETVHQMAAELGVTAEGKTLSEIISECHNLCFGGATIDGSTTAAEFLEKLTAGEQQAECCICFDYLHERPVACFCHQGKRTCAHFFHEDCATELLGSGGTRPDMTHACPICRRRVDTVVKAPKASADPEAWFRCVDVESNGKLARADVMSILVSQFPIDHAKLEEAMPTLWEKWDKTQSGYLTKEEVIGADGTRSPPDTAIAIPPPTKMPPRQPAQHALLISHRMTFPRGRVHARATLHLCAPCLSCNISGSLLHMVTTHLLKEEYLPPAPPGSPERTVNAGGGVVRVMVPAGVRPGQQLEFEYGGQRVRITLPANARPGQPVMCRLPAMPPRLAPQRSFHKNPSEWFAAFDVNNSGRLTRDQLLRALVKTNPTLTASRASELIQSLGLLEGLDGPAHGAAVSLEHFLSIHEILLGAVASS